MLVNEIFKSIEGEGARAGHPCVFVRFQGCNLNCSYCDTAYAHSQGDVCEFEEMTPYAILARVKELSPDGGLITLTGGEPLLQDYEEMNILVQLLKNAGFWINFETNGSIRIDRDRFNNYDVMYTMDVKCPSSGVSNFMCWPNLESLGACDVAKFVVGSQKDLMFMKDILDSGVLKYVQTSVSPVFGKIEPKEIVEFLLEHHMDNVRMQLQMHKFIWEPSKRGV